MKTNPNANAIQAFDKKEKFSDFIVGATAKNMLSRALPSDSAARLTSTLMSVVSSSPQLQQCKPISILSTSLRGEGMGLVYGHGYYIVPYGDAATFILSYKGMISLCLQTGKYTDIDCLEVREGEYKGRDKRTGKPILDFSVYEDDEQREAAPVIGYYAYFELRDGYFRYEYWNMDKLLKHAVRYARFDMKLWGELLDSKTTEARKSEIKKKSLWYDVGGTQEEMFKKTCLRSLLNSGYAPMSNAIKDAVNDKTDETVIPTTASDPLADFLPGESQIDETTGEILSDPVESSVDDSEPVTATVITQNPENAQKAVKNTRKANARDVDEIQSFFEGGMI